MKQKPYTFIDHTADIGVKASANTLEEAFSYAAQAMFDIITDNSLIEAQQSITLDIKSSDLEQLLVDFLDELLYLFSAENLVFCKFDLHIKENHLTGTAQGEPYDTSKHNIGVEIKAVTYHMLEVKTQPKPYVQILFDI